jgi:hypothetical protein
MKRQTKEQVKERLEDVKARLTDEYISSVERLDKMHRKVDEFFDAILLELSTDI